MFGRFNGHVQVLQEGGRDQLEGEHIGCAVAEQAFSGFLVLILFPAKPEVYGFGAIYALEVVGAVDAQSVLNLFEATSVLLVVALPSQINVGAREFRDMVGSKHEGHVEAGTVEGDQ